MPTVLSGSKPIRITAFTALILAALACHLPGAGWWVDVNDRGDIVVDTDPDRRELPNEAESGSGDTSSDPESNSIKIISVETSTPGGACSPPREDYDFICQWEITWTIEYTASTLPVMAVCDIIMDGERDLLRGQGLQEASGSWATSAAYSGFFEAMGDYPAQFICELRAGGMDGEVVASAEETITAPLTTNWEE